jgi:iron complex outermembrane receptor protein
VSVSIGNISAEELENRNTVTIDNALQYVSGLTLTGGQLSIRGSSGYSRGVGSRVMMLLDGLPYLTGDTHEANFVSVPTQQVDHIEIVKGAGSALYGSSALGGVINVINKKIEAKPQLNFRTYAGLYTKAYYPEWRWTDATRFLAGIKVDYSAKPGSIGYRIGTAYDRDESYRLNDEGRRYYVNGMLEADFSAFQELSLTASLMKQEKQNFLYWKDLNNALRPPDDQLGDQVKSERWHVSADYRHVLDNASFFSLKSIWFQNHFDDNIGAEENHDGNESRSIFWDTEFQYNQTISKHQLTLGVEGNINQVDSDIFADHNGKNAAVFAQDEFRLTEKWIVTPGLRIDYYNIDSVGSNAQINPKIGIVFRPKDDSALRLSAGRGYRAPSIAEIFTNTTASGLEVIPNLSLKPERSQSAEVGYNQFFAEKFFFDIAFYYNRFWDLIEGTFTADQQIQFRNVTNARTVGCEVNFSFKAFSDFWTNQIGYTFIDARDLSENDYLIFRSRHLLYEYASFEWKSYRIGLDYRFISAWDRIDENLVYIINDADVRGPAHIVDLRFIYTFSISDRPFEISLQLKNLLQYYYVDLVGSIAPTQNFVFTFSGKL